MKIPLIRNRYTTILMFLSLACGPGSLTGQAGREIRTERISFPEGARSAVAEDSITGYQITDYLLNVRAGQQMNISMTTGNRSGYFNVMEPGEEYVAIYNGSINGNRFGGTAARSGDYRIRVYLMRSAARRNETAAYRLVLNVSDLPVTPQMDDAKVPGTPFHAAGTIPCSAGVDSGCSFGVIREGNGSGSVTITKPDGRTRTIFFENGRATGYDFSQADPGEFRSVRQGDTFLIQIGEERYEIPDAVIYGG